MDLISSQLAHFIANTSYDDIPDAIRSKAVRHTLDTIGAGIAGAISKESDLITKLFSETGDLAGNVSLWGKGICVNSRNAAFHNGIASHAFELDDTGGCDHSGAVVIPAALAAVAQAGKPVTGREFIRAVVLGYDIARRALESCGGYEPHNGAGFHSTGTCGPMGAAAAAGVILNLSEHELQSALGIATSYSAGFWAFIQNGGQNKRLHAGNAAQGGLTAALLAKGGMVGPTHAFEDVWGGFSKTLAPASDNREAWTAELGQNWKLARVSIKPYSCCRSTHSSIDGLLEILNAHQLKPADVASIRVIINPFVLGMCGKYTTDPMPAAQMSIPYALAAILVYGTATLGAYTREKRANPKIKKTMARVQMVSDSTQKDDDEPFVEVTTTAGAVYRTRVPMPLGAPTNPIDDASLLAKFMNCSNLVFDDETSKEIAETVLRLPELEDARLINDLLALAPAHRELFHS
ncbi:MAG: MmgE/PrpD family protein [Sutterellaceae bacterium]|nr:MmgE/PrpD family protein [Sutterellaceae bacterium]MDD7441388.1 MmgE/PrpD family protein [Sutterellaceae bacterium]MDY2867491.1 MmgE/PrpD family protein [Mesosutterella sp.]